MSEDTSTTVRALAAVLVVVLALTATGFGLWNPVDRLVAGDVMDTDPNDDPTGGGDDAGPVGPGTATGETTPTRGGDTGTPLPPEPPGTSTPASESDPSTAFFGATDDDGDGDAGGDGSVDLRVGDDATTTLFDAVGVVPGTTGVGTGTLANDGRSDGTLRIEAVSYTSSENGRSEAEADVDDTGGDPGVGAGELGEAVELRVAVERPDEPRRYVVGDANTYRDLPDFVGTDGIEVATLDGGEELSLLVEWRVAGAAGNEIQTDGVDVTVSFRLTG